MATSEPALMPVIKTYVSKLPDKMSELEHYRREENWDSMSMAIHKLKGSGGGYGYPLLTKYAIRIENSLHEKEYESLDPQLDKLHSIINRIMAGISQEESQISQDTAS